MPVFWLGIIARYYLAEGGLMTFFPDGEYVPLTTNPAQWLWHMILPWCVLAVLFIGFYGRVLRSNILDTVNEDYVRTARAKGINPRRVHAQACPTLLVDPDRHAVRPRLRRSDRRRGDPDGDRLDLHGVGQYAGAVIGSFDLPPIQWGPRSTARSSCLFKPRS
jgi:peptide/nickel transport system permease protein